MTQRALGPQFGSARKIPVEKVGFRTPLEPRHDPNAMVEGAERQPPGVRDVVGALFTGALKPQPVDPRTTSIRATQDRLTRGSLEKHYANPGSRGRNTGGPSQHPVLYREGDEHYALDGHHRIAGAMLRQEQFHAIVIGPEHKELAEQFGQAQEHLRERWSSTMDTIKPAPGKVMYGPPGHPDIDHEARERQSREFTAVYPEHAKNSVRKKLGLPPRRKP